MAIAPHLQNCHPKAVNTSAVRPVEGSREWRRPLHGRQCCKCGGIPSVCR
jgi:hypothetical protein